MAQGSISLDILFSRLDFYRRVPDAKLSFRPGTIMALIDNINIYSPLQ